MDMKAYHERKAQVRSYLGQWIQVEIDRPVGYVHCKGEKTLTYPINYGYLPGILGGDGEELDVYVLGTDQPLERAEGRVVGIVHRADDVEDKLVLSMDGTLYQAEEMERAVAFQEQYYHSHVEALKQQEMSLTEAVRTRRSYRGMYKSDPVPREHLKRIMEAALAAPSGCNQQTTSVIAVDEPDLIRRLGSMLRKPNFASAPAALCILTEKKIAYRDRSFYVQDYAAAIQNALLTITALGYESCWVEGYVTGEDAIGRQMAELLGVPSHMELVAYLPIGRAAEEGSRVQKLPFEQRAWFNGYQR